MKTSLLFFTLLCFNSFYYGFGDTFFDELADELRQEQSRVCTGGNLFRLPSGGIECCRGEGKSRRCTVIPCELEEDELRQAEKPRVCVGGKAYRRDGGSLFCCRGRGVTRRCKPIQCQIEDERAGDELANDHRGPAGAGDSPLAHLALDELDLLDEDERAGGELANDYRGPAGAGDSPLPYMALDELDLLDELLRTSVAKPKRPQFCNYPPVPGPCKGSFTRWYYNPASRSCKKFIYGGCKGNKNNFNTKDECMQKCS